MKPSKLESIRVLVEGVGSTEVDSKTVSLTGGHVSVPLISITLEPLLPSSFTDATVSAVSTTSVGVNFSSPFRGYLHLHAVSEK